MKINKSFSIIFLGIVFIGNILLFFLTNTSDYTKNEIFCKTDILITQNNYFNMNSSLLDKTLNDAQFLLDINKKKNNKLHLVIEKPGNLKVCNEVFSKFQQIVQDNTKKYYADLLVKISIMEQMLKNSQVGNNFFLLNEKMLDILTLNEIAVSKPLIDIKKKDSVYKVDTSRYTILIFLIFNFFLIVLLISLKIYSKTFSNFFGSLLKNKI